MNKYYYFNMEIGLFSFPFFTTLKQGNANLMTSLQITLRSLTPGGKGNSSLFADAFALGLKNHQSTL